MATHNPFKHLFKHVVSYCQDTNAMLGKCHSTFNQFYYSNSLFVCVQNQLNLKYPLFSGTYVHTIKQYKFNSIILYLSFVTYLSLSYNTHIYRIGQDMACSSIFCYRQITHDATTQKRETKKTTIYEKNTQNMSNAILRWMD